MTRVNFKMRNVAISFACLAATTALASCEPADEPGADAPAFVEFSFANQRGTSDIDAKKRTVKAVAECGTNLASLAPEFKLSPEGTTATVDGKAQESGKTAKNFTDAVVYTLTTPDGTTAEWTVTITLPDDCEPSAQTPLYSYNPPAGYYIVVKETDGDSQHLYGYAYGNGKYAEIADDIDVQYWQKSPYASYSSYSSNRNDWADYSDIDEWGSDTDDESRHIYHIDSIAKRPGYAFNLYLCSLAAHRQGESYEMFPVIFDINTGIENWEVNLQNYDATQHTNMQVSYLRSEVVNGVDCYVFSGKGNVSQTKTFWVDKNNGLTLKYTETNSPYGNRAYEVVTYQLTEPNWDAMHLRPQAGDEVVEP